MDQQPLHGSSPLDACMCGCPYNKNGSAPLRMSTLQYPQHAGRGVKPGVDSDAFEGGGWAVSSFIIIAIIAIIVIIVANACTSTGEVEVEAR